MAAGGVGTAVAQVKASAAVEHAEIGPVPSTTDGEVGPDMAALYAYSGGDKATGGNKLHNSVGEVAPGGNKKTWSSLFRDNRIFENDCKLDKVDMHAGPVLLEDVDVDELKTWGHCIVAFVAGRFPGRGALHNLSSSWGVPCQLIIHPSGWVIFKFQEEEHKLKVLGDGPHSVFGRPMILKDMPGYFDFNDKFLSAVPCWVNLPGLPLECWNKRALSKISSAIGTPITMDRLTARRERIAYARVLVEVDTSAPIMEHVEVRLPNGNLLRQEVNYETMPMFCSKCKRIGHLMADCGITVQPQGVQQANRARSRTRRDRPSRGASRRPPPRGDGNPGTSGTRGTAVYAGNTTKVTIDASTGTGEARPIQDAAEVAHSISAAMPRHVAEVVGGSTAEMPQGIGAVISDLEGPLNAEALITDFDSVRKQGDVTPSHKASLKLVDIDAAVTEMADSHVAHEETSPHTAPLQDIEAAVTELHASKEKKGSATIYVMDQDIFRQKVWELVDEEDRGHFLSFLKKRRKLDPVCSEEELQTDGFIAKVIELVRKHERHAFIARLEDLARKKEAEESTGDSDDSEPEDPKDECEMDWTVVGRGGRAKNRAKNGRRGRGGRGPRGRRGR